MIHRFRLRNGVCAVITVLICCFGGPLSGKTQVLGSGRETLIKFLRTNASEHDGLVSGSCLEIEGDDYRAIYLLLPRSSARGFVVELRRNVRNSQIVVSNIARITIANGIPTISDNLGGLWTHTSLVKATDLILAHSLIFDSAYEQALARKSSQKCPLLTLQDTLHPR